MGGLTIGHILALIGLVDLGAAIWFGLRWAKFRTASAGTPLYARGRDARRLTFIFLANVAILWAAAFLTPLWHVRVA